MAYDKNWKFKDVLSAEKMIYGLKWDKHSFEHSFKQWAESTAWLQAGLLLRGSCRASADGGTALGPRAASSWTSHIL